MPENIRCVGDTFTTLGEIITIRPFQTGLGPSIERRVEKIKNILDVRKRRDYHGNLSGRALAANTYLQSQLSHLLANASLTHEDNFKEVQKIINGFVNKKHITAGDTIYLPKAKGGMDTPNLYAYYLSMKAG